MILKELSEAIGISGREEAVRRVILQAIEGHAQDITIDPLGSVTARKPASAPGAPRVLLAAHMDEVGFMVMGFDGDGLIRFTAVGGIDDRILPGLRVRIGSQAVQGVIVWTPIHKNNEQNTVKMSNLRIDIGASSKDEASGKVKRGDLIAFDSQYLELGEGLLRGKAFDDRAGCSLLIDVLQSAEAYPVEVLAAFTVQEEIGLRGAQVVGQTLQPDAAFILEGTTANDIPDAAASLDDDRELNPTCRMRGGPVLTIVDARMIVPPNLLSFLRETAEAEGIPYQYKSHPGGATDGGAIHLAGSGVQTAVISLPCRYIHTPLAYLHREDYDHTLRLIQAVLRRFGKHVLIR
ncbi:M20/M25/M40 family metallo-hydrolase [Oscillatoria laete-virens NRMC-F 0139]|nr:M20/M25/M40 family metallo-hydrolase [Oscillatoria laete-virens]MDL5054072.1 M20/M25/M40 family metallo-hydrolase [Oscillatoria laete-virens NRMC-F 0139]